MDNTKRSFTNYAITPAELIGLASAPPTHGVYMFGRVEYEDTFKKKNTLVILDIAIPVCGHPLAQMHFELCNEGNDSD